MFPGTGEPESRGGDDHPAGVLTRKVSGSGHRARQGSRGDHGGATTTTLHSRGHPAPEGQHPSPWVPVSPQLVRGELEHLQPDVRWGHPEAPGPVHTAGTLQSRAGLSQPVSAACTLQPTGLPLPELPTCLEHWALDRGNLGKVNVGGRAGPSLSLAGPVAWGL